MQNDRGNLSIDFLAGITIFMIALIWVATMIPGLLVGVQTRTIDVDAISYRTGVILAEDPGMPITPPWENKNDYQKSEVERFGLAASKDTPNILKMAKIERFFCATSFSYPTDYKDRLIFGDRPYGFNITLSTFDGLLTRSLGDLKPEEYGYIRRLVKIKYPSNTTIDAQTLRNSANVSQHVFSIQLNLTELIGNERNYAYQINPRRDQIMVNFTNLSGARVYTTATNRITLNSIDIYRRNPLPPYTFSKVTVYANDDPKFQTYVDGSGVTAILPSLVNDNVSVVFLPGYFYGMADDYSTIKISYTFNLTDPDNFFNNSFTSPYSYNYSPAHVTQPRLNEGVLEVATWTAPFGSYAPSLITATPTPVQPPVADFYGTPRTGGKPLLVAFTDVSTGVPTTWNWTFGDIGAGNTSTLQNPTHTYTSAGSYSVNLTVSNVYGSSTLIKTSYITVGLNIPIPAFTGTPLSGTAPLAVSFTDATTNNPTIWNWTFGDIGAGNTSALQNPSHTYTKTGRYSVNLTAFNGDGNATLIKTNYISVNPATSWKCDVTGWNYRKNITIDRTKVYGTQTNFPILINLGSDSDLAARARTDGYDIFFTASDGTTKIPHEIESFTKSTGALIAWVKVPSISDAANTTIFMYYGNPSAGDQQDKNNVWDTNYKGVWHLAETVTNNAVTSGVHKDSTSNFNNGTQNNNDDVAGKIGIGQDFEGDARDEYIEIPDAASVQDIQEGEYTIESWFNSDTTPPGWDSAWNANYGIVVKYGFHEGLHFDSSRRFVTEHWLTGDVSRTGYSGTKSNSNWYHVVSVVSKTAGTVNIYVNGVSEDTVTFTSGTAAREYGTTPWRFGIARTGRVNWAWPANGKIDEIRISNSARSGNWIKTEYNNQNSPSTFHYIGSEEEWSCEVTPTLTPTPTTATPTPTPTPSQPWYCGWWFRKNITIQHAQVSGTNGNFPVLINLPSDSDLVARALTNGNDILFTQSDMVTKIPHEIESYSNVNGALVAWVKVPSVSSSADTTIAMYYGNAAAADQQDKNSVWGTTGYQLVSHMKDDPDTSHVSDSTANGNNGAKRAAGQPAVTTSGKIGNAQTFDGTDDRINTGSGSTIDDVFASGGTVEAWIYPTGWGESSYGRVSDKGTASGWSFLVNNVDGTNTLMFLHGATISNYCDWITNSNTISLNQWQHVAATFNRGSISNTPTLYINGNPVSVTKYHTGCSGSFTSDAAEELDIGNRPAEDRTFAGRIDEFRLSNTIKSSDWIKTEYNNQNSPATFYSLNSQQQGSC